jgi:hypothetical protein
VSRLKVFQQKLNELKETCDSFSTRVELVVNETARISSLFSFALVHTREVVGDLTTGSGFI